MKTFRKNTFLISLIVISMQLSVLWNISAETGLLAGLYRYGARLLLLVVVSFFAVKGEAWALKLFGVGLCILGGLELLHVVSVLNQGVMTIVFHALYGLGCIIAGADSFRAGRLAALSVKNLDNQQNDTKR